MTRSETEILTHDADLGELNAHEPVLKKSSVVAVLLASALLPFAVTGPAVVLPDMARSLDASATATQWIQDGYNTAFAAGVLGAGALADRFGRRLVRCRERRAGGLSGLRTLRPIFFFRISAI